MPQEDPEEGQEGSQRGSQKGSQKEGQGKNEDGGEKPERAAGDGRRPLLHIADMHVHYGAIHAIQGITLSMFSEGEIVTILGPNGAGKTTTLHAISGLIPLSRGEIVILMTATHLHQLTANKIVALRSGAIPGREGWSFPSSP